MFDLVLWIFRFVELRLASEDASIDVVRKDKNGDPKKGREEKVES